MPTAFFPTFPALQWTSLNVFEWGFIGGGGVSRQWGPSRTSLNMSTGGVGMELYSEVQIEQVWTEGAL